MSGGGDGEAARSFLSYFFSAPVLLHGCPDILDGPGAAEWTRPNDLSKTLSTVPLYVLTSTKTLSAAEAVVYQLKRNQRATIVGETTAGAGNRVDVFGLAYDFYFVNSIGNPYNTPENSDWEGSGIQSNIKVSSHDAFERTMSLISTR